MIRWKSKRTSSLNIPSLHPAITALNYPYSVRYLTLYPRPGDGISSYLKQGNILLGLGMSSK